MNVHLSEDKEVISVCSQQLSIVALMRRSTVDSKQQYNAAMQQLQSFAINYEFVHDITVFSVNSLLRDVFA